jgi:hypothetical protein
VGREVKIVGREAVFVGKKPNLIQYFEKFPPRF